MAKEPEALVNQDKPISNIFRTHPIRDIVVTNDILERLYRVCNEACAEIAEHEIDNFRRDQNGRASDDPQKLASEELERRIVIHRRAFIPRIIISQINGEEIITTDPDDFKNHTLTGSISEITIDSKMAFKNIYPNGWPPNHVIVTLKFNDISGFDPIIPLSVESNKSSQFIVAGGNAQWCSALYGKLAELFRPDFSIRQFLHKRFAYDIILYFVWIPIIALIAFRYGRLIDSHLKDNTLFALFASLLVLSSSLIFFRFAFAYARWSYPSIELENDKSRQKKHRAFWIFLTSLASLPFLKFFLGY